MSNSLISAKGGMKRLLLAITISLISVLIFFRFAITEGMYVKIDYEIPRDKTFQIFYISEDNKNYQGKFSVSKRAFAAKKSVKMFLPVRELRNIRLDIGNTPDSIRIEKIQLSGASEMFLDLHKLKPCNIQSYNVLEGGL